MYGQKITPCIFCTSAVPGGRMPRAQGCAGAAIQDVRTEKLLPAFSALPPSLAVVCRGRREAQERRYRKYGQKITPCIFCTSAIPGGGMPRAQQRPPSPCVALLKEYAFSLRRRGLGGFCQVWGVLQGEPAT